MKKQYIIIYEHSYDKLEERVNEAMEQGYKPQGSMVYREGKPDKGNIYPFEKKAFIQPMLLKN